MGDWHTGSAPQTPHPAPSAPHPRCAPRSFTRVSPPSPDLLDHRRRLGRRLLHLEAAGSARWMCALRARLSRAGALTPRPPSFPHRPRSPRSPPRGLPAASPRPPRASPLPPAAHALRRDGPLVHFAPPPAQGCCPRGSICPPRLCRARWASAWTSVHPSLRCPTTSAATTLACPCSPRRPSLRATSSLPSRAWQTCPAARASPTPIAATARRPVWSATARAPCSTVAAGPPRPSKFPSRRPRHRRAEPTLLRRHRRRPGRRRRRPPVGHRHRRRRHVHRRAPRLPHLRLPCRACRLRCHPGHVRPRCRHRHRPGPASMSAK